MGRIQFKPINKVEKKPNPKQERYKKQRDINLSLPVIKANHELSYMIYAFQRIKDEYLIDFEQILLLLYLYDLGVFNMKVSVLGNEYGVGLLIADEFVESYEHIDNAYQLTNKGKSVIKYFREILRDRIKYVKENRVADIDAETLISEMFEKAIKKST